MRRDKLSLRREVLAEIDTDELREIVAADPTQQQTRRSCLTYVSCYPQHCANTRACLDPEPI